MMGNCLSTPNVKDGLAKTVDAAPSQYKSGKAAHDSVHSLDTAGPRDAAQHTSWGTKQQQQSPRKQQQKAALSGQGSPHGSSRQLSTADSMRKRKPPGIDLATGKQHPDFNVNGILDVLHELGSGGSGTTYLCRDLASGKVS